MTTELLKQKFSSGVKPTGADFAFLIDTLNQSEIIDLVRESVGIVYNNQTALNDKVVLLEELVGILKTNVYDDTVIVGKIGLIESEVEAIKTMVSSKVDYDDTELKNKVLSLEESISTLNQELDGLSSYDDSVVKATIQELETAIANIKPYDDTELRGKVIDLETTILDIKPYDDTPLTDKVTTLESVVGALENYDDSVLNGKVATLENTLEEMGRGLKDSMPLTFTNEGVEYRYGFKPNEAQNGLVFMYQEVN